MPDVPDLFGAMDAHITKGDQPTPREMQEQRIDLINKQYAKAEADEKAGTGSPDVVYSGLGQRTDAYTADPAFDKSREAISDLQSLPVKQYEVLPSGDFAIVLDEDSAALEELRLKKFCHNCEDRQPEIEGLWELAMKRLEDRIGPRESWMVHGAACCYCGARLGIEGDYKEGSSLTTVTPEQSRLLERMFGPMKEG